MPPFSRPTLIYELATYSAMVSTNGVICASSLRSFSKLSNLPPPLQTLSHPSLEHRQRFTNLMNHLLARHPDYEQVVQSMTADTLVVYACSDKAKTVFGWLEWLVDGEMLLNFTIFDDVIAEIPDTTHHLNSTAAIVKHAPFENALVKIQRGQGGELTAAELKAAQNLIVTDESEEIDVDAETGLGFAARALQRRRIAEQQEHRFMDTVFLEPTSNSVEWLFSTAKLLFSDKRKRLLPKTLEQLLFLCAKRDLWGLGEVAK
ncbi:hypothetical protein JG687_00007350, partial [Phytophthora cactorum]